MPPKISIVVPLAGGAAQALSCLEGIAAQPEEPSHEIVIVDDCSADLAPLLARLEGDVEVIRTERRLGFAGAALCGAARAAGEIIVFIRDAAVPADGWLAPLAGALEDPGVGLAASASADAAPDNPVIAWSFAVRAADLRTVGMPDVPGPHLAGALSLSLAHGGRRAISVAASAIAAPRVQTIGSRRPPGEEPQLTIVIPTLDATSERVRACLAAVHATTDIAHEIVIVDNGSPPQGFSAPVNAGLRAVRTPYAVVMNDDVEPLAGWWPPLRAALDAGAPVAFPLTVEGAMRYDFPAWCFAMSREGLERFSHAPGELFDPSLVVWFQDMDLLVRLQKEGRKPVLADGSRIRHGLSLTVASDDAGLQAWIQSQIAVDQDRFVAKHPGVPLETLRLDPDSGRLAPG
jgi:glycosyltransferase involved in cell wall biosynthesis